MTATSPTFEPIPCSVSRTAIAAFGVFFLGVFYVVLFCVDVSTTCFGLIVGAPLIVLYLINGLALMLAGGILMATRYSSLWVPQHWCHWLWWVVMIFTPLTVSMILTFICLNQIVSAELLTQCPGYVVNFGIATAAFWALTLLCAVVLWFYEMCCGVGSDAVVSEGQV